MSEYELPNGYILTDDEIERRASEWENGTWGTNDGEACNKIPGDNPRLPEAKSQQ